MSIFFLPALLVSYTVWSQWGSSGFRKGGIYHIPEERESWEDVRENVLNYNEEGGGERDQVWCSLNSLFAHLFSTSLLFPGLIFIFFSLLLLANWPFFIYLFFFLPEVLSELEVSISTQAILFMLVTCGHLWEGCSEHSVLDLAGGCHLSKSASQLSSLFQFVENSQNTGLCCTGFKTFLGTCFLSCCFFLTFAFLFSRLLMI